MTELELSLVFEKSLFLWRNSRIYFAVFVSGGNLARTWLLSFRKIIWLLVEEMETLAEQLVSEVLTEALSHSLQYQY